MTTSTEPHRATGVDVGEGMPSVTLDDGRELTVPLSWFLRLELTSEEELPTWELIGSGVGIHWCRIDEHVSVRSLIHPEETVLSREVREAEERGSSR